MRMTIRALAATLVFCATSSASPLSAVGAKLGMTAADQELRQTIPGITLDFQRRAGLGAGVFGEWFRGTAFSLVTEVNYLQKGSADEQVWTDNDGTRLGTLHLRSRVSYLSLPVLAKLRYEAGRFAPYALVGPRMDVHLSHETDALGAVYDDLERTVFGIDFGIGTEYSLSQRWSVLLEGRYSHDLTDAFTSATAHMKNRSFQAQGGVVYRL